MAAYDNPAARIAAVLQGVMYSDVQRPAIEQWSKVLNCEGPRQLAREVADLLFELDRVKEAVEDLPVEAEDPEFLLRYYGAISDVFSDLFAMMSMPMKHYAEKVDMAMVDSMEHCSRALRRNNGAELTLTDEAASDLLNLIRSVIDDVSSSDLSEKLKLYVIRRLRDVEEALLGIKISGIDAVEAALDALIGGTIVRTQEGSSDRKRLENWVSKILGKLQSLAKGVSTIATTAAKVDEIRQLISGE